MGNLYFGVFVLFIYNRDSSGVSQWLAEGGAARLGRAGILGEPASGLADFGRPARMR
ncbi:hypothetical protein ES707_16060 [subsurface metagenome]